MDTTQPIIVFGLGSKQMFDEKIPIKTHGIGLAFLQWLLRHPDNGFTILTPNCWHSYDTFAQIQGKFGNIEVFFVTNLTSVNSAGTAIVDFYKQNTIWPNPENLIIVQDDTSVPELKVNFIQKTLIAGGHRGVADILRVLQSDKPMRIKIGPAVRNLDEQINLTQYINVFAQALMYLEKFFASYTKAVAEGDRLNSVTAKVQAWLLQQNLVPVIDALNPPERVRKASKCVAIPVITPQQEIELHRAVDAICEAVLVTHKNYRTALTMPGKHEIVELVRTKLPDTFVEAGDAQQLSLNFFGIDFHAGGTATDVTWIESNMSSGAPEDDPTLETFFEQANITSLGVRSLNSKSCLKGMEAIVEYALKPLVHGREHMLVAILLGPSKRFDGLDRHIATALETNGIKNVLCEVEDLTTGDTKNTLFYRGTSPVGVVVYFGNTGELVGTPLWTAITKRWIRMFPSGASKFYTRKTALPLFGKVENHNTLGIPDKLSEQLQRCVAYADYVTYQNANLIRYMLRNGIKVPIKHAVGGGGRSAFMLDKGWPQTPSVLNAALEAYDTDNPAIFQEYAPKFEIPGTPYEFDVRAIVYTGSDGKRTVNYSARVYRVGENALLGTSPIYVLTEEKKAGALMYQCSNCKLQLPEKFADTTCPKCKVGMVKLKGTNESQ